jgi:hypothetical protein
MMKMTINIFFLCFVYGLHASDGSKKNYLVQVTNASGAFVLFTYGSKRETHNVPLFKDQSKEGLLLAIPTTEGGDYSDIGFHSNDSMRYIVQTSEGKLAELEPADYSDASSYEYLMKELLDAPEGDARYLGLVIKKDSIEVQVKK